MKKPTGIVNIHGREYQTVAFRVQQFRELHPAWTLLTKVLERTDEYVVMEAQILDEAGRLIANGHAEEYRRASSINKTSALENAETSAIGRALASLGIGGTEFASADEVARAVSGEKASVDERTPKTAPKELLGKAATAADAGVDAFRSFWKSLGSDERLQLEPHLNALKAQAESAMVQA